MQLRGTFGVQSKIVEYEEIGQNLLGCHADGFEQNRYRHLAATVNAEEQNVLRVKLEVKPRTTVRNDTRREQQLARRVRLATVMFKEHAWRTVQLRYDHAFSTVDDE